MSLEVETLRARIAELEQQLALYQAEKAQIEKNLAAFDTLDFEAYSKQNWALFDQIHSAHVKVSNFDGSITNGIQQHNLEMHPRSPLCPILPSQHIQCKSVRQTGQRLSAMSVAPLPSPCPQETIPLSPQPANT